MRDKLSRKTVSAQQKGRLILISGQNTNVNWTILEKLLKNKVNTLRYPPTTSSILQKQKTKNKTEFFMDIHTFQNSILDNQFLQVDIFNNIYSGIQLQHVKNLQLRGYDVILTDEETEIAEIKQHCDQFGIKYMSIFIVEPANVKAFLAQNSNVALVERTKKERQHAFCPLTTEENKKTTAVNHFAINHNLAQLENDIAIIINTGITNVEVSLNSDFIAESNAQNHAPHKALQHRKFTI